MHSVVIIVVLKVFQLSLKIPGIPEHEVIKEVPAYGAAGSEEFDESGQEGGKEEKNDFHAEECRAGERCAARRRKAHWTPELGIRDPQISELR